MEKIIVAFESEKTALRVKELLEGAARPPAWCAAPPTRCGGP
ncbi:MAG: hypothetical protein ACLRNQ_25105 [Flavonifractor plautii]